MRSPAAAAVNVIEREDIAQLEDDTNSFGLDEALDAILRKHGGPNARYGGLDQEDAENDDA